MGHLTIKNAAQSASLVIVLIIWLIISWVRRKYGDSCLNDHVGQIFCEASVAATTLSWKTATFIFFNNLVKRWSTFINFGT